MRRAMYVLLCFGFLPPALGLAVPMGRPEIPHPLAMTPAEPETPPEVPSEVHPPVLELTLPEHHGTLGGSRMIAAGAGQPPDLTERVALPAAALPFRGRGAQPFGGSPSGRPEADDTTVVPEPGTGLLMMLGLGGLAIAGRPRRAGAVPARIAEF